jgi:hypothetical protein
MLAVSQTLPPPELSDEVRTFAAQRGVSQYLSAVAAMTRKVFPHARMRVAVVKDPELDDNAQVMFEIDDTGLDIDELYQTHNRWTTDIFKVCPATHVHVFSFVTYSWQ